MTNMSSIYASNHGPSVEFVEIVHLIIWDIRHRCKSNTGLFKSAVLRIIFTSKESEFEMLNINTIRLFIC